MDGSAVICTEYFTGIRLSGSELWAGNMPDSRLHVKIYNIQLHDFQAEHELSPGEEDTLKSQ